MNNLELRLCEGTASNSLRVNFDNCLSITINQELILREATNLGGNIVSKSLILFTSQPNLLKLVKFIADL